MTGLATRAGSVPGSSHTRKFINNQDAHVVGSFVLGETTYSFGAVFDGCTGSKGKQSKTEVGAALLAAFFRSEIPTIISAHTALADVPGILYQRSVGFFGSIARSTVMGSPDAHWQFVQNYLLCTVVGYVSDGVDIIFFSAGDGVLFINDGITIIDQNNKPMYLAYHLLDRRMLGGVQLPTSFMTTRWSLSDVTRFAISTDGIAKAAEGQQDYIAGIWGYEPAASAGLQWHLNKGSNNHLFSDDCTIIASWQKTT